MATSGNTSAPHPWATATNTFAFTLRNGGCLVCRTLPFFFFFFYLFLLIRELGNAVTLLSYYATQPVSCNGCLQAVSWICWQEPCTKNISLLYQTLWTSLPAQETGSKAQAMAAILHLLLGSGEDGNQTPGLVSNWEDNEMFETRSLQLGWEALQRSREMPPPKKTLVLLSRGKGILLEMDGLYQLDDTQAESCSSFELTGDLNRIRAHWKNSVINLAPCWAMSNCLLLSCLKHNV